VTTDSAVAEPTHAVDSEPLSSKPAIGVTTDFGAELAPPPSRSPSASACEIHKDAIDLGLSRGRNAMAIFQDLVDGRGFTGSYESVKRFVRKLRGRPLPEASVLIETAPGEEAQVDYGTGPMVRDPNTGKYRRTRLFVLTLGYSRKAVRLLVFRSSSQTWAELHEKAFRRLGGVTRVVVRP
jgi:transposase